MPAELSRAEISAAVADTFVAVCRAELRALKPGNVHVFREGRWLSAADFQASAEAAAAHLAQPGLSVGARIARGVEASIAVTPGNTNLGIILLAAPLAQAVLEEGGGAVDDPRAAVSGVLDRLTVADAEAAFGAIVRAEPGGLGRAAEHDVHRPPTVTLKQAMAAAQDRDRVARQYATSYEDIFEIGMPRLHALRNTAQDESAAIEGLFLHLLAAFPDSHIERKHGDHVARDVRTRAQELVADVDWTADQGTRHRILDPFDKALKERGINPGTTGDLTVTSLLADRLWSRVCALFGAGGTL